MRDKFLQSAFLQDFRDLARSTTRGCIVLERPDLLKQLVEKHGAKDSTVRQTAMAELDAMTRAHLAVQSRPQQIPEKSWAYRLAKRFWFNDFGAYRGMDHSRESAPALLAKRTETDKRAVSAVE